MLVCLGLTAGWGVESSGQCVAPFRLFIVSNRRASRCAFHSLFSTGLPWLLAPAVLDWAPVFSPPAVALKYAETRPPGLAGIVLVNAFTSTPLPALATRGFLAAQGPPEWMFRAQPPPEIVARALLGGGGSAAVDLARGLLVEFHPPPKGTTLSADPLAKMACFLLFVLLFVLFLGAPAVRHPQ